MRQFKVIMTIPILNQVELYCIDTGQIFYYKPNYMSVFEFEAGMIVSEYNLNKKH